MRRHLLTGLGVAVDGLIGAVFSAEVFGTATAFLGAASAWVYRHELGQAWRRLRSGKRLPAATDWGEFNLLPLKHIACLWHGLPPGEASMQKPIVQEELARLSLAVRQRKLEHWNGDTYHGLLFLLGSGPSPDDQFTKEALVRYAEAAGRKLPAFLREKTK